MAARKPKVDIQPQSLRLYDEWSTLRDESKSASTDLGNAVKEASATLDVSKWAWKNAAELRRMDPVKASSRVRDFMRLLREFGLDAPDLVDQMQDDQDELDPVA